MTATAAADPLTIALAASITEAVLAGVDLRVAAEVLEQARTEAGAPTLYAAADRMTALAATVPEIGPLAGIVIRMRDRWLAQAVNMRIEHLRAGLAADAEAGHAAWHDAVAEAVAAFRFDIAALFAGADLPIPDGPGPAPSELAAWALCAEHGRWREARPLLAHLATPSTRSPLWRARAFAILAELEAVVRQDFTAASRCVAASMDLAPDDWRSLFIRARVAAEEINGGVLDPVEQAERDRQFDQAEALFAEATQAAPQAGVTLAYHARLRVKRDDLEGAEALILQAIQSATGPAAGLSALIELCGEPRLFPSRRDRIACLVDRASLLSHTPQGAYEAAIEAGRAFDVNRERETALDWFAKAEALSPDQILAPLNRGYLHMNADNAEAARADFERVVALAPDAVDGHWGLANLAEEIDDWPMLLRHSARSMERAPEWRDAISSRLRRVAATPLETSPGVEIARQFYDGVRDLLGPSYEASYRNLLGNLAFFQADHALAAAEYDQAITAAETPNARYYGNLALALEAIDAAEPNRGQALRDAIVAAKQAQAIAPEDPDYRDYLARFAATEAYTARYGLAARTLLPDTTRLRVLLEPSLVTHVVEPDGSGGDQLSQAFGARMRALRQWVAGECHFTLPGVQVRDEPGYAITPGWWAIEIGGMCGPFRHADATITSDALMDMIESAIRESLPALIGHGEAREIAQLCPDAGPLLDDPGQLTAIVRRARTLLRKAGRIDLPGACTALLEPFSDDRAPLAVGKPADDGDERALHPGRMLIDQQMQAAVFERTGVVVPLSDHPGSARPAMQSDAAVDALAAVADRFLGVIALRWQLGHLRPAAPDLVAAAEAMMDEAALLEALRTQVRQGGSIRNLRQAIEDLVVRDAEEATASQ